MKAKYTRPTLTVYGTIAEVTHAGASRSPTSSRGGPPFLESYPGIWILAQPIHLERKEVIT